MLIMSKFVNGYLPFVRNLAFFRFNAKEARKGLPDNDVMQGG